jgi:hypothetical protein
MTDILDSQNDVFMFANSPQHKTFQKTVADQIWTKCTPCLLFSKCFNYGRYKSFSFDFLSFYSKASLHYIFYYNFKSPLYIEFFYLNIQLLVVKQYEQIFVYTSLETAMEDQWHYWHIQSCQGSKSKKLYTHC